MTYPTDTKLISAVINQCFKFSKHLGIIFSIYYKQEVDSLKKI
jgi:hypothetical protein